MNRPAPSVILLATDLGARSDRARQRACMLARRWQARLVVLTVVASEAPPALYDGVLPLPAWADAADPVADARAALAQDMAEFRDGLDITCEVGVGETGPAILRAAARFACDLVVVGTARGGALRSALAGTTVSWLTRHASQPLLVVRSRPRQHYQHIAFASDFSPPSRVAARLAARWFGDDATTASVLHGADVPMAGLVTAGEQRDGLVDRTLDDLRARAHSELAQWPLPDGLDASVVVERMDPARLVDEYARSRGGELVSLGSHGRSALLDVLLGSVALRILETARCDLFVVRHRQA